MNSSQVVFIYNEPLLNGVEECVVKTDYSGLASAGLELGSRVYSSPTDWWEEGYTYPQRVGENIVEASLPSGITTDTPLVAYGFPDKNTAKMYVKPYNIEHEPLTWAGPAGVYLVDENSNPFSNISVWFEPQDSKASALAEDCPLLEESSKATLFEAGDDCMERSSPVAGECDASSGRVKVISHVKGAHAQVLMGGKASHEYPIKMTATVAAADGTFKNLSGTATFETRSMGACSGEEEEWEPDVKQILTYSYQSDGHGNNINAGKVGKGVPVKARTYLLKESEMGEFTIDTDLGDGSYMEFEGVRGKPVGFGVYTGTYTLSAEPKRNRVNIEAHVVDKSTSKSYTASNYMYYYGVEIDLPKTSHLLVVDDMGRVQQDARIDYTIKPNSEFLHYVASTAHVFIYERGKEVPLATINSETFQSGFATIGKGFELDLAKEHYAQVVLNHGSGVEIRSDEVSLDHVVFEITEVKTPCLEEQTNKCMLPSFVGSVGYAASDEIELTASATYKGEEKNDEIKWSCDNTGVYNESNGCPAGEGATHTFDAQPLAMPAGRDHPVSYLVRAEVTINELTARIEKKITQDKLDELRQEYIDFRNSGRVPQARAVFDTDEPYDGKRGGNALLGDSAEPTRFEWHILSTLNGHAEATQLAYGATVNFTSGYRTPIGNERLLPASSQTSNHQYGKAFDFQQLITGCQTPNTDATGCKDSEANYDIFAVSREAAGAEADTYLTLDHAYHCGFDDDGNPIVKTRFFYNDGCYVPQWPPPAGYYYKQGHAAWND